jgi:RNA-directed DNA polymerase
MEVAMTTGASLRQPIAWHSLNWRTIHRNVRRLQVRIVKAWQAGKKRKARALQFILTRSLNGKALAVRRVTENQGKWTAGVDGETWRTPAQKAAGIAALQQRGYRAQPLKRVYIPKRNGKKRPLWHSHHLIYKVQGGADSSDNRVLLHPNCHRQVHCQGLNVAKPRPSPGVGKA